MDDQSPAEELLQLVEESLEQAKQAYRELEEERGERIRLEKVASTARDSHKVIVNDLVTMMVDDGYIEEDLREKFASDLSEDPSKVLNVVNRLITISAAPVPLQEGRGIPKRASEIEESTDDSAEEQAWLRVLAEGA